MSKKAHLAAALHEASGRKKTVAPAQLNNESLLIHQDGKPPSRVGKKIIAGHFDPVVLRQIKQIALDQDRSIQSLLSEALNDLFEKHNMKPLA